MFSSHQHVHFGLGDLDPAGDALTLLLLGDGDLFLAGGEREADRDRRAGEPLRGGDLDLGLRPGLPLLSLKGDLGAGDLLLRAGLLRYPRGEGRRRGGDLL